MDRQTTYKIPPLEKTTDGSVRSVGFELEFSGISLDQTAEALKTEVDAKITSQTEAEQVLSIDALGEFRVELDWDFLKRKAEQSKQRGEDGEWVGHLGRVAAVLVPVELICPPLPIAELKKLDPVVAALRRTGATGTEESLVAAYGVHVNVEIPELEADILFSYVRAYCLLQWWLVEVSEVDNTRKMTPYVDLYPEVYIRKILEQEQPALEHILSDYLAYNASRNRALDLLPMLAEIDKKRVREAVNDPRIKPRPAFHYRLPNCHIERPGWSLAEAWNNWWVVEQLAARSEDLDELSALYLDAHRPLLGVARQKWVETMDRWLDENGLA